MNRLEDVRILADKTFIDQSDYSQRREGLLHTYGVCAFATLLAKRRQADAELCAVAGMLHDLWRFSTGEQIDHAKKGAEHARTLLSGLGSFSAAEINLICAAIVAHSDKEAEGGVFDEILKDADVLQHYCYDPNEPREPIEDKRLAKLFGELGISGI